MGLQYLDNQKINSMRKPKDKSGYLLLPGQIVYFVHQIVGECMYGTVEEIVSNRRVRISLYKESAKYFKEKQLIINGKLLVIINWNWISGELKCPLPQNYIRKYRFFENIGYKPPEVRQKLIELNKQYNMLIVDMQMYLYDFFEKLHKIEVALFPHENILEIGDIVFWNDSMEKRDEPFLCQITDSGMFPEYARFGKRMKLNKRTYWRYESEYNIIFRLSQKEFRKIMRKYKFKTSDAFVNFALLYLKKFEYLNNKY